MSGIQWGLAGVGGVVAILALRAVLRLQLRYQIGRSQLRICLWGVTLRRVPLEDIEKVSKPRRRHSRIGYENWTNTLDGTHRELVIHRRTGLFRKLLVSPSNRYEFRKRLETAVSTATGADIRGRAGSEDGAEERDEAPEEQAS